MAGSKGLFVVFGAVGASKSTEVMTAFQDAFLISTRPNQIAFYKQWLVSEEGKASGKRLPTREVVLDAYAVDGQMTIDPRTGLPIHVPQKATLEYLISEIMKKAVAERAQILAGKLARPTYRNLVIDEAGTFWERIFAEIAPLAMTKDGRPDGFRAYGIMNEWTLAITEFLRQFTWCGMNVCLVCHDRDPSSGRKGGANVVSENIGKKMTAASDGALMRVIVDQTTSSAPPLPLPAAATSAINAPRRPPEPAGGLAFPGLPLPGDGVAPPPVEDTSAAAATALTNVPQGLIANRTMGRREWRVHCSEKWDSKLVGLPDSMFEEIRTWPLEKILRAAGYEP